MVLQNLPIHGIVYVIHSSPSSSLTLALLCSTTASPGHLCKHFPGKPRKCPPHLRRPSSSPDPLNLKPLTSHVIAQEQHGKLNTIIMNAVLQACVHYHDIDYALKVFDEMSKPDGSGLMKLPMGLGDARRIDKAFQVLESVEKGTIVQGTLDVLMGLLARYGYALQEGGQSSILTFNLLMKVIFRNLMFR
ncbi:pentatricopeptide repeat-containing protein at5g10690 [Phtheirospermum japonicum]|uniref:Pentatricopeptide repeat-containing protein at5g10690 n=1 Tax=Phtheirospermum japonicum TaxID=374723 RepID=A0A830BB10_9LAMI|nr:pentatricopeptide repeat-containing protein at5g10690 [Phtheirospermum japonicum]